MFNRCLLLLLLVAAVSNLADGNTEVEGNDLTFAIDLEDNDASDAESNKELRKDFLRAVQGDQKQRRLHHLGQCESDCDRNSDCAGSLVCWQRGTGDPTPPCCSVSFPSDSRDYCVPSSCAASGGGGGGGGGGGADDSTTVAVIACFSGDTKVDVFGKGMMPMEGLQVGDKILTGQSDYQRVYSFGHYHPTKEAEFLVLSTDDNGALEVSRDHLIYLEGKPNPVRAGSIKTGDRLQPLGVSVTHIDTVAKHGIYAPLTADGTLVLNGNILASSYVALIQDTDEYAEFQDGTPFIAQHTGIHMVLTPFRMLCRAVALEGVCQSFNDDGMPHHVAHGIGILKWLNENSSTGTQAFLLAIAYPFFGATMVIEKVMFSPPLLILAAFVVWRMFCKRSKVWDVKEA
ncbi:Warthog protein [Seminavis robusta]|uniref:Warthog protein n=1 Tax=Seminavis robusta TaxID=568900 RepID=A0A9N8H7Q3_9STRA|nr:Warthog protein [Seminavis robusta]|eukprot:Sro189_g081390.1 Warthog protein (401) ;mRNA; r:6174-7457